MLKICEYDQVEFEAKRADARFCSPACRKAGARAAGVDGLTGAVIEGPVLTQPDRMVPTNHTPISDNPFERLKDKPYDYEKNMAAFRKMGLDQVEWLTTGIPAFDTLTKIPRGRLTQIEGRYSVGKTTLCLNMISGLTEEKHKVLYIDTESALNPDLLAALKIDAKYFELYNTSAYLEDIGEVIKQSVRSGDYELIILDSLAMTTTKTIDGGDLTASNIGQKAKIFNKVLELIMGDLRRTKTALVIINQTRDVIGSYVPQTYTPGGSGKDYNASLKISLKTIPSWRFGRTAADTKAKRFVGQEIEATITKSKVNTPHRTAKFRLYYPPRPVEDEDVPF
jgi:RecA/RadA recombinase